MRPRFLGYSRNPTILFAQKPPIRAVQTVPHKSTSQYIAFG